MTGKALLNYRTKVPASKSLAEITDSLVKAGARAISTEYDDGSPTALRFLLRTSYGERSYVLPANVEAVARVLEQERAAGKIAHKVEPEWVAWRIVKDWIEAQAAIVRSEMVTLDQVMLPYMETATGTVYELVRDEQLALARVP